MLTPQKAEQQLFGSSLKQLTRPPMKHVPAPVDYLSEQVIFKPQTILNKRVLISDQSEIIFAVKRPKKKIERVKTWAAKDFVSAANHYLDESVTKTKNLYYLIVDTPKLDNHNVVIATTDKGFKY